MRALIVSAAVPAVLLLLGGGALAAGPGLLVTPPDLDVRALTGTVVAGVAAGILLAIITERRS